MKVTPLAVPWCCPGYMNQAETGMCIFTSMHDEFFKSSTSDCAVFLPSTGPRIVHGDSLKHSLQRLA